jgi:hypothetical protein
MNYRRYLIPDKNDHKFRCSLRTGNEMYQLMYPKEAKEGKEGKEGMEGKEGKGIHIFDQINTMALAP